MPNAVRISAETHAARVTDPREPLRARDLRSAAAARFEARLLELARARRRDDEGGSVGAPPPAGGPLGLHALAREGGGAVGALGQVERVVERMIVGTTREGLPEVRLEVGGGVFRGLEVRLAVGGDGVQAIFVAATEAARRVLESELGTLARGLAERGLDVARCEARTRDEDRRDRRQRRDERERRFDGSDGVP